MWGGNHDGDIRTMCGPLKVVHTFPLANNPLSVYDTMRSVPCDRSGSSANNPP